MLMGVTLAGSGRIWIEDRDVPGLLVLYGSNTYSISIVKAAFLSPTQPKLIAAVTPETA